MNKTRLVIIIMLMGVIFYIGELKGSCPSSHPVVHDGVGGVQPPCQPSGSCLHTPKFWCLSGGTGNNNGSYVSWWFGYVSNKFNGDWNALGVNGCCGMWDGTSFDSKTMVAVIEVAANEGLTTHQGYVDVEVAEARSNGYFFTRGSNLLMQAIPHPRIANITSTGAGGVSTFDVVNFSSGYGSINYWVILENGVYGNNLTLNPRCSPGGASTCPPPIEGYRVVAMARGCADGTCMDPTPAPPTTSVASQWNLPVSNGDIQGRTPTFPKTGVQVTNPEVETPANAYIWVALIMLYGYDGAWDGRIPGVYTSANWLAFKWGFLGAEITSLEANYVSPGKIKIRWKSVVEGNIAGYNVYRSYNANGTYTRVNLRTIPAKGIDGTLYTYTDKVISSIPRDIYYRIEVLYQNGQSSLQPDIAKVKANPR